MRRVQVIPMLVGTVLMLWLAGCSVAREAGQTAQQEEMIICRTGITAGLTEGPHAPLDLSGDVELWVRPDMTFTGTLTLKNEGGLVAIRGQGVGRGVDLVFDPGDGTLLYAHGAQEYSIWECKGTAGGPLVGPEYGDQGDWTTYPPYIRTLPID